MSETLDTMFTELRDWIFKWFPMKCEDEFRAKMASILAQHTAEIEEMLGCSIQTAADRFEHWEEDFGND